MTDTAQRVTEWEPLVRDLTKIRDYAIAKVMGNDAPLPEVYTDENNTPPGRLQ